MKLTELQFEILDGMTDDYEDVEQLYLYANRNFEAERRLNVSMPLMIVGTRFPLRDVIDEVRNLLERGLVRAKYSNDESAAPLSPVNVAALHHYWFGATAIGTEAWKAHSKSLDEQPDRA